MIQLSNVKKSFADKVILDDVSVTITKGETIALIGMSGTGKTTFLNLLTGTVKQDSGQVNIDGKEVKLYHHRELAKKIGIMRQQFNLVEQLSVLNNVLAGRLGDWSFFKSAISLFRPIEKPVAETVLERVGLLDKIYEKTFNLSGGEQQRVALARLLMQAPEILLADEPIASLDPSLSEEVMSIMTTLVKEEQMTLVSSLHSVDYAMKYFNRIIGLKDGKIYIDSAPDFITKEQLDMLYRAEEKNGPI